MVREKKGSQTELLKVAMIGHKRVPSREGGVELVVEELSTRLVKEGLEVDVYNRKGHHISGKQYDKYLNPKVKEYRGVRIITIPQIDRKGLGALSSSILGSIRALFGKYQIIHYHAEGPCAMIWLPHLFGIKTVATIHGLDWNRAKWNGFATKYLKWGEKIAVKYADEIIVLSKNVQTYFRDNYGRETNYIPNGVNIPKLRKAAEINKKWALRKDSYILFLGRIVPEKGVLYLIDAFLKIDTDKKMVIAGGASDTNKFMQELRQKTEMDDRIIFTDFVEGDVLDELYSNAYFYVLPSDLEGMPISLLEAMSYGNCCLVSDIPECVEVVEDKAVVFKHSNTEDLMNQMNFLLCHSEIVEKYRKEAASFICNKYNWNDVSKETLALYQRVLLPHVRTQTKVET